MKFAIGSIGKSGERSIIARPKVLTKEGEPASITQTDTKTGAEQLWLSSAREEGHAIVHYSSRARPHPGTPWW